METDKVMVTVRLTREERKFLSDAAHDARISMNEYCKRLLLAAADKELAEAAVDAAGGLADAS